jgi:hypothetical protein
MSYQLGKINNWYNSLVIMVLYGVFGSHTTQECPLNNSVTRKLVIEISEKLPELARKNYVDLKEQFHSALEHNFLWILEAENGHVIQRFMIESGWAKFNKMKIFPIGTFKNVVEELKRLEQREA